MLPVGVILQIVTDDLRSNAAGRYRAARSSRHAPFFIDEPDFPAVVFCRLCFGNECNLAVLPVFICC